MPKAKTIKLRVYEQKTSIKIGETKRTLTMEPMISKPGGKARMVLEKDPIAMDRELFGKSLHVGDVVVLHIGKISTQTKLGVK